MVQLSCVKHVQLAVGACLKSKRQERFGSHEDHCRAACRAGFLAIDLDRRLRRDAIETAELSAAGNTDWLAQSRALWHGQGSATGVCSATEFNAARKACDKHCLVKAKRRDLEELQGLAVGKDFLTLQPPVFGCRPSAVFELLSRDDERPLEWLYPPGHPRRAGTAAQ